MTELAQMTTTIQGQRFYGLKSLHKGEFVNVYPADNLPTDEQQYKNCYWATPLTEYEDGYKSRLIHRDNFEFVDDITYTVQFEEKDKGMYAHETICLTDFNDLQRAYGRCTSKIYYDTADEKLTAIGWTFERTERYDDTNEPYIRITWVTRPRHLHIEEK